MASRKFEQFAPRTRQRGVVLIFALIVLLILAIAAVALLRSVNTSLISAGNLAFHQDLINQGEEGVSYVVNEFRSNALPLGGNTTADVPTANYKSTILPANAQGVPTALLDDTVFNTVGVGANDIITGHSNEITIRYVIDRLCTNTGVASSVNCSQSSALPKGDTLTNAGGVLPPSATVYRVSVRVTGPRSTQAFLQSTFTSPD
jgi:type IV pilus assembly protein PilX